MKREEAAQARRQEIIDAALKVFSQKGFQAATNKDIAQAAGINSAGLIYHYFEDKQDLFQTVLQERMPVMQPLLRNETVLEKPIQEVLSSVGEAFVETLADPTAVSLLRLLLGEAVRQPEIATMFYQTGSTHIIGFIYWYLDQLMDRGDLKRKDVGVVARSFLGPFFMHIVLDRLLALPDARQPDPEEFVHTVVATFLEGATK